MEGAKWRSIRRGRVQRFLDEDTEEEIFANTTESEFTGYTETNSPTSSIDDLTRSAQSEQDEENLTVFCFIDGYGCIFSEIHLEKGRKGGKNAARKLQEGIRLYLQRTLHTKYNPDTKLIIMLFLNKDGLGEKLERSNIIKMNLFSDFLDGFCQADPFMSVIDCGSYKNAADEKIIAQLNATAPLHGVSRVLFGGSHDNTLHETLLKLTMRGYAEKLVLLKSYWDPGSQIKSFRLPNALCDIEGLFMQQKLEPDTYQPPIPVNTSANSYPKPYSPRSPGPSSPVERHRAAWNYTVGTTPAAKPLPIMPESNRPCFYQYLSGASCTSPSCKHRHDLVLLAREIQQLREQAVEQPCTREQPGHPCTFSGCYWGHYCPRGQGCRKSNCAFHPSSSSLRG